MMQDRSQKVHHLSSVYLSDEVDSEPFVQHCGTCDEPVGWQMVAGHDILGAEEVHMGCRPVLVDRSTPTVVGTAQVAVACHVAVVASWAVPFHGAYQASVLGASAQSGSCTDSEHIQVLDLGRCWQLVAVDEREDEQDLDHRDCSRHHMHDMAEQEEGEDLQRALSLALGAHLALVHTHRSEPAKAIESRDA